MICSSLGFVSCIVRCNIGPEYRILLAYPSPGVCGSVHETSATLFFLLWAEVPALLGPHTRCSYIPPFLTW